MSNYCNGTHAPCHTVCSNCITCCKQWGFCHVHQRFYTRRSLEQCPFLLVRESIPKAGLAVGSAHDLVWVGMVSSKGQVGKLAYFCDLLKSI